MVPIHTTSFELPLHGTCTISQKNNLNLVDIFEGFIFIILVTISSEVVRAKQNHSDMYCS